MLASHCRFEHWLVWLENVGAWETKISARYRLYFRAFINLTLKQFVLCYVPILILTKFWTLHGIRFPLLFLTIQPAFPMKHSSSPWKFPRIRHQWQHIFSNWKSRDICRWYIQQWPRELQSRICFDWNVQCRPVEIQQVLKNDLVIN